ncbi:MAG: glycosyltransferase family 2 protein [Saprospiraceae bacterium]
MKISILTPAYNAGNYIERAILSVAFQDYTNWEHIVVDGMSTDNTPHIISKYNHIKYTREPDNGQSDAMNKAFELSTGDIIVFLNADDEIERGAFNKIIDYFKNNTKCNIVVGNLKVVKKKTTISKPSTDLLSILDYSKVRFPLNSVSYYYKPEVQHKIGFFPIDNHYSMDYWFLLRAYKEYKIYKIDEVLGSFHFTGVNKTSNNSSIFNELINTSFEFAKSSFFLRMYWYMFHYGRVIGRHIQNSLK